MSRGGGNSGFRSQLTPTGQCAFPTLNRRGLRSSGWIVAHPDITPSPVALFPDWRSLTRNWDSAGFLHLDWVNA
jgi:hypothetical protein